MNKILTYFLLLSLALSFLWAGFSVSPLQAASGPDDPYYFYQWYLSKIGAEQVWTKINSSPSITIAVIDSGVDIKHPDLKDNIWINDKEKADNGVDDDRNGFIDDVHGWDFVDNSSDPSPKFEPGWTESGISHGTIIAGIIAATGNNGQGVSGVTWQAKLMPLRVLNDSGEGRMGDVIRAIDYAVNNGADIINLSFVSFSYSEAVAAAIFRAYQAGVIVVAAAGNEQSAGGGYNTDKNPVYPACYDGKNGENMVLGVAATDALDQKAKFSSYGFNCVDITAPGVSFFNTITRGGNPEDSQRLYDGFWSGTSMAAPVVSGSIALIMEANPELNRQEIIDILFNSAVDISRLNPEYLGQLGYGRINVSLAVDMAKEKLFNRSGKILISSFNGKEKSVIANHDGAVFKDLSSDSFANSSMIAGDVDGDGRDEIIMAAGAGSRPMIKIFKQSGELLKEFLAFESYFTGGLNVALGDVDGDGLDEIVAISASSGSSQLKIFNYQGQLKKQFFVDGRYFRGGFDVAAGDIDGYGEDEIAVSYGAGLTPLIKLFNYQGKLQGVFLAYEKSFRGGVEIAIGNIDGRSEHNKEELIVAPGPGRLPTVKIFDNHANLLRQFEAYGPRWQGGVNVAAGDLYNNGRAEIITGAYPGAAPHVRTFDGSGQLIDSFYAYSENFSGGAKVGFIRLNN